MGTCVVGGILAWQQRDPFTHVLMPLMVDIKSAMKLRLPAGVIG
jgi:hypothetical protein